MNICYERISALNVIDIRSDGKRYIFLRNELKYQEASKEHSINLCHDLFGGQILSLNSSDKLRHISNILTRLLISDGFLDTRPVVFWTKD